MEGAEKEAEKQTESRFTTLTLHRYYMWANRMRKHFYELLPGVAADPDADRFSSEVVQADIYMSLWYGELYVVFEGWKELGLRDTTIDGLLTSPNVELLKRYRNGVFHFQRDYFDDRFMGFMQRGVDAAAWVLDLNLAFGKYFIDTFAKWKSEGG